MWVFSHETQRMEHREATFVPGIFKIFDEILVNAADNKMRDDSMKYIRVTIDRETGEISVENDGKGIPIEVHEKEGVYVPQMVFGELLTGDNYNDGEERVVGGRNGYGAKLANIFSTRFEVATCDTASSQTYKQVWLDNMAKVGKPKITSTKKKDKDYTRVTFTPDYERFKLEGKQ